MIRLAYTLPSPDRTLWDSTRFVVVYILHCVMCMVKCLVIFGFDISVLKDSWIFFAISFLL